MACAYTPSRGRGRGRQLPVRRGSLRGDLALHAGDPLPLLALPQALRSVRVDRRARAPGPGPGTPGRGADSRLPAGGRREGEGVLLGMRVEPLRRRVAQRGDGLRAAGCARRRSGGSAGATLVRRVARGVGGAPGRRPAALPGPTASQRLVTVCYLRRSVSGGWLEGTDGGCCRLRRPLFPQPYRFAGNDRAYAVPSSTHLASSSFVATSSASTRSQPRICRPRISSSSS